MGIRNGNCRLVEHLHLHLHLNLSFGFCFELQQNAEIQQFERIKDAEEMGNGKLKEINK